MSSDANTITCNVVRRIAAHPGPNEQEMILICAINNKCYKIYTLSPKKGCIEWINEYLQNLKDFSMIQSAFDTKTNALYILLHDPFAASGTLLQINAISKSCKTYNNIKIPAQSPQISVVNGTLYLFDFNSRFAWNPNTNQFAQETKFPYPLSLPPYIFTKNKLFLFNQDINANNLTIHSRNIFGDDPWNTFKMLNSGHFAYSEYVVTNDGKFIIILGSCKEVKSYGYGNCSHGYYPQDDIHYFNTKTNKLYKSNLKLPYKWDVTHRPVAVIRKYKLSDDLTVDGYVRNIFQEKEFKDMIFPPQYLVQIISRYYENGVLYVFDKQRIYKLKLDDIFG